MARESDITRLLAQWKHGQEQALDELIPLVYDELRGLARGYLRRERPDHTLQPTALVHELFLRLVREGAVDWEDRSHFFGIAARVMRQILVAHARQHAALKRGGGADPVPEADATTPRAPQPSVDLAVLDDALSSLAALDARQARIVELRFFGGYTIQETAELIGCSRTTANREWELARIWLFRQMRGAEPS